MWIKPGAEEKILNWKTGVKNFNVELRVLNWKGKYRS